MFFFFWKYLHFSIFPSQYFRKREREREERRGIIQR